MRWHQLWQLFSELLTRCVGIFVHNGNLLKKVSLPKFALPVVATHGLTIPDHPDPVSGSLALIGGWPGGRGICGDSCCRDRSGTVTRTWHSAGTINVFYRDVEQTVGLVLNFWFWLTPIVYPARALPSWLAGILEWNPMWPLVRFAQSIFLDHQVEAWSSLLYPTLLACVMVIVALRAFRALSADIVDEL